MTPAGASIEEIIRAIRESALTSLPSSSFVILQVDEKDMASMAKVLQAFAPVFDAHKIDCMLIPKSIDVTVVPAGTDPKNLLVSPMGGIN